MDLDALPDNWPMDYKNNLRPALDSSTMVGNALVQKPGVVLPTRPNSRRLRNIPYFSPLRIARSLLFDIYHSGRVRELVNRHAGADELRGFASPLQGMSDSQANAYYAAHREIRIRMMSGKEFVLTTISSRSTWFDFHMETRRVIGIPLAASPISIRITLLTTCKSDFVHRPGDIMPCTRVPCGSVVRGCIFQVICHKPTTMTKTEDPVRRMIAEDEDGG